DLQAIVIDVRKAKARRFNMGPVVQVDTMVAVPARIEGRMNLDETFGAVEHHELARGQLGCDVERKIKTLELCGDCSVAVRSEGVVPLDRCPHPARFASR